MLHRLTRAILFIVLLAFSPILAPLGAFLWIIKGGTNVYIEALTWSLTGDCD
jgi:hypothetical protein